MAANRINDEPRPATSEGRGIDPIAYQYDRPVLFYVLATAIPWACWFAAAYLSHLPSQTTAVLTATLVLSAAGLLAPIAVVIGLVWHKPNLRTDIWRRMAWPKRAPLFHVVCAFLLLPASLLLAQAISLLGGYDADQFLLRDGYTFSAGLMPVWVTLLGAAVVEELAWHSYGTDTLIRRMSVFTASMVFTVIWVLWHLPLSFIDGYYHNEVVKSGVLHTLNFPASMIAFVILMNWLYFRCGRSILIPIIFHISANFSAEMFMTDPDSKVIQTGILLILSVVVVIKERRLFFTRPEPEFRAAA
ncbi:MAG TPA: CPBP family intramembrane glutamic endopeptidase [Beutenbergiaceae bacterium]|nr:CPBP family intramembrane glutamic endopeptidase [Beutenbergiaceae bacterium]